MVNRPFRVFYRIVRTVPPTLEDFTSHEALGIPSRRPLSASDRDRWRGVSSFDSVDAVMTKARESPLLGGYVAELHIPPGAQLRVEQTGRNLSHYTLWGDPADLLSWVVSVSPR